MPLVRAGQYATYLAVRAAVCALQCLRLETFSALAPGLAWLCADVLKLRGAVVDENLTLAFPQLDPTGRHDLARRMWEHLLLLVGEVALSGRKIHPNNWRDYIDLRDSRPALTELLVGRPVVIVSGHYGNFELGNYMFGILGVPTLAVARQLDNPFLDTWMRRFRGGSGQRMVDKKGGYDDIVTTLERGGAVLLLGDQYAGSRGCWVKFFGRPASTHKAIALFALQFEAPLFVAYARRTGRPLHYEVGIRAIADPRAGGVKTSGVKPLTQWYTQQLEEIIRAAPEQYWWVHRRWKGTEAPRRRDRAPT